MMGGAVMAGRASQRAQYRESDQDQRLDELESQQAAPAPVAAAPAAPAAPAEGSGIVAQLKQLGDLKESGVLSAEEFEAAKQKLLAS
jgi:Short C-terminal domain